MRHISQTAFFVIALSVAGHADNVASMSGTWNLKVDKSSWGKKAPPKSVSVKIDHQEPSLKYNGVVDVDEQGGGRAFEFSGALDGKEYPIKDDNIGEGKITFKRINARTTESVAKSTDGKIVESSRTTVSKDGKTMTRHVTVKSPEQTLSWTEVYEKL